jgi:hypothetical protein
VMRAGRELLRCRALMKRNRPGGRAQQDETETETGDEQCLLQGGLLRY